MAPLSGSPSDPPQGSSFGPYQVERLIGRGGLGAVYLARDEQGAATALKLVDLGGEDAETLRDLFARESAVARRLLHPGIVQVRDTGQLGHIGFMAMEFVAGGDLEQLRARRPLPLGTVVQIASDIAGALEHAHGHGVLHRDIKPGNILLDAASGHAKLTDFGLARLSDLQRSRTGVLAGTPAYMSPEQLAEGSQDPRSDLYSLGVVLFELLAGRLPHEGGSLGALLRAVSLTPAPPLQPWRPDIPEGLADLVARLLEKDRSRRPGDATSVAGQLRKLALALAAERDPDTSPGA